VDCDAPEREGSAYVVAASLRLVVLCLDMQG
jgi:hypothetical protein